MRAVTAVLAVALLPAQQQEASAGREPFDEGWRFIRAESPAAPPKARGVAADQQGREGLRAACKNITLMPGLVTMHLKPVPGAASLAACQQACCSVPSCETAQWCGPQGCGKDSAGKPSDQNTCWTGLLTNTRVGAGWQSYDMGRGHSPAPSPPLTDSDLRTAGRAVAVGRRRPSVLRIDDLAHVTAHRLSTHRRLLLPLLLPS